jgi:hypothetical protein
MRNFLGSVPSDPLIFTSEPARSSYAARGRRQEDTPNWRWYGSLNLKERSAMHFQVKAILLYLGFVAVIFSETRALGFAQQGECPAKKPALAWISEHATCPARPDEQFTSQRPNLWTHDPDCMPSSSNPIAKYCVFTASFFGDAGISFIAAPETAANYVSDLYKSYHSSFPSGEIVANWTDDRPFEVIDIPGKGKGVIATRLIRQHETFMVDHASIIADKSFILSDKTAEKSRLLQTAVWQLGNPTAVMGLSSRRDADADKIEGVLLMNTFHFDYAEIQHEVLFPTISVESIHFGV